MFSGQYLSVGRSTEFLFNSVAQTDNFFYFFYFYFNWIFRNGDGVDSNDRKSFFRLRIVRYIHACFFLPFSQVSGLYFNVLLFYFFLAKSLSFENNRNQTYTRLFVQITYIYIIHHMYALDFVLDGLTDFISESIVVSKFNNKLEFI